MAKVETYHRVKLQDPSTASDYQDTLTAKDGYIGSYVVDVQGIEDPDNPTFVFHVIAGFRRQVAGEEQMEADQVVADLVAELEDDTLVAEVRTLSNPTLLPD